MNGELAALADGDYVLHLGLGEQQRSREEEPAGLGRGDVGRGDAGAYLVDEAGELTFVLKERNDIHEYDSLLGKIVVKL